MVYRPFNTNAWGYPFEDWQVGRVWVKGTEINGQDPDFVRTDKYGNEIHYEKYGRLSSLFGWEVDHILPVSKGGTDEIINLQPLQWNENRVKGEKHMDK